MLLLMSEVIAAIQRMMAYGLSPESDVLLFVELAVELAAVIVSILDLLYRGRDRPAGKNEKNASLRRQAKGSAPNKSRKDRDV